MRREKSYSKTDALRRLHEHMQAEQQRKIISLKDESKERYVVFVVDNGTLRCYGPDAFLMGGLMEEELDLIPYVGPDAVQRVLPIYEAHEVMEDFIAERLRQCQINLLVISYDTSVYDKVEKELNERNETLSI